MEKIKKSIIGDYHILLTITPEQRELFDIIKNYTGIPTSYIVRYILDSYINKINY